MYAITSPEMHHSLIKVKIMCTQKQFKVPSQIYAWKKLF